MLQRASYAPTGRLAQYVRSVIAVSGRDHAQTYERLPNGELELAVRIGPERVLAHVLGARTTAVRKQLADDAPSAIVVRFKAGGAYPFLGVPVAELTDRGATLEALWGADGLRLREAIAQAPSLPVTLQLIEAALRERLLHAELLEPDSLRAVRRAIELISAAPEPARIELIARDLGVSARQLRRVFTSVVGLNPKTFARIARFQRALRGARAGSDPEWSTLATHAGYYDQSHLIADFRALAGATPSVLLARLASERAP